MANIHLVCSQCGGINRVLEERLNENPICGKCQQVILDGRPVNLGSGNFPRFIDKNDLPVLVDFWADWCGPCKTMAPVFSSLANQMSTQLRFAKVETEKAQDIATRFGIRSIPTLILFKHGKEIDRVSGALDQNSLKQWVNSKI